MAATADKLELGADEFAFHFETEKGVDADALANFLKRAATIARQRGGELRVVGLREGSLAVIVKAIKRSRLGRSAAREFAEKPIDTGIKVSAFAASIVGAIIYAMSPSASGTSPLAKAGAEVVEKQQVTQISIVTNEASTVVMNESIAAEVRQAESNGRPMLAPPEEIRRLPQRVVAMIEDARHGNLSGEAALVLDQLHFRPDGYKYWVPVEENPVSGQGQLYPGGHFRVSGHIVMLGGQPDRIVVDWATPME